jgi:hypothetical protein
MGDFIEGPIEGTGRFVEYTRYHNPLSPAAIRDHRESERRRSPNLVLAIGGLLTGAVITQGVILHTDRSNAEESFAELADDRCFVTSIGALGMVESSDARAKSVKMIFPSGLRETYPINKLSEVPCATVSDAANARNQGDRR